MLSAARPPGTAGGREEPGTAGGGEEPGTAGGGEEPASTNGAARPPGTAARFAAGTIRAPASKKTLLYGKETEDGGPTHGTFRTVNTERRSRLAVFGALLLGGCGGGTPPATSPPPPAPSAAAPTAPPLASAANVDAALREEWKKAGLAVAPAADDGTWLRRVYIDLVGTIPPPDVVTAFLADAAPSKREQVVDRLLASPEYATHWANYWEDTLIGHTYRAQIVDTTAFRTYLTAEFAANRPWDKVAYRLLAATGQNAAKDDVDGPPEKEATIDPAVNWTLKYLEAPQDYAGSASRVFLGVQIQCAQCHDHKTEAWKQKDFQSFASAALHFKNEQIDKGMVKGLRRVDVQDAQRVIPRVQKDPELAGVAKAPPVVLDGTKLPNGLETRKAFAGWMTSKQNAWFAKAFVNRMWGHFLGRGFSDPVDDLRPSNPLAAPAVLELLANDFVASNFDVRHLLRTIALSEAYAASASKDPKILRDDGEDVRLWTHFRLTPLGPEELLNALFLATGFDQTMEKAARAQAVDRARADLQKSFGFLFDVDEEFDAEDYSGTVTQALTLMNGGLVNYGAARLPGSALDEILKSSKTDSDTLRALFLRSLGRPPTAAESTRFLAYVAGATRSIDANAIEAARTAEEPPKPDGNAASANAKGKPGKEKGQKPKEKGAGKKKNPIGAGDPAGRLAGRLGVADPKRAAWEDVFWSLLTSSEFFFNH
jgi:hypothetical protein